MCTEDIIVAPPMPREARIRIICTSLCQTDISFWKIQEGPLAIYPRILGHEAIGVVESVGEDVTEVAKGDVVLPTCIADCGECIDCKSSKSNLCSKFPFDMSPWMPRYATSRFTDLKGNIIHHFLSVSSFSEYAVVDIAHLTKIDTKVPPNRACLLSCGVSTGNSIQNLTESEVMRGFSTVAKRIERAISTINDGHNIWSHINARVGAAWRTAGVEPGSTVAIFGLGCVGLAVAEGARLCGATTIIGVDINPKKYEIGKKFGLTDFVHAEECANKSISQVIIEMTSGGADYCFECVGVTSLVHEAYASCRKGWGKTIVLGGHKSGSMLSLSIGKDFLSGKSLIGSLLGGIKPKSHVPILLKRYIDKELKLDEFVTHEVEFNDINKAFDLLVKGESIRCVIWMDK
ncbi:hypothetical protein RJT34_11176 [Clitoria ternatea]|uniref:Alcohol dehydrogenase n=1 Tax=Clitoria ternatea TaxID=43366 RepID=A0AAN9PJC4_CLITE